MGNVSVRFWSTVTSGRDDRLSEKIKGKKGVIVWQGLPAGHLAWAQSRRRPRWWYHFPLLNFPYSGDGQLGGVHQDHLQHHDPRGYTHRLLEGGGDEPRWAVRHQAERILGQVVRAARVGCILLPPSFFRYRWREGGNPSIDFSDRKPRLSEPPEGAGIPLN